VIEKAFAAKIGNYEELDDDTKHTVNEFWPILVGTPQGFSIDKDTDLNKIKNAAKAATTIPTIGASRNDATAVLDHHGFAILGMQGSNIDLFDPHGKKVKISLEHFQTLGMAVRPRLRRASIPLLSNLSGTARSVVGTVSERCPRSSNSVRQTMTWAHSPVTGAADSCCRRLGRGGLMTL
jgi:hypothetical protein